jgi:hypothetical protein
MSKKTPSAVSSPAAPKPAAAVQRPPPPPAASSAVPRERKSRSRSPTKAKQQQQSTHRERSPKLHGEDAPTTAMDQKKSNGSSVAMPTAAATPPNNVPTATAAADNPFDGPEHADLANANEAFAKHDPNWFENIKTDPYDPKKRNVDTVFYTKKSNKKEMFSLKASAGPLKGDELYIRTPFMATVSGTDAWPYGNYVGTSKCKDADGKLTKDEKFYAATKDKARHTFAITTKAWHGASKRRDPVTGEDPLAVAFRDKCWLPLVKQFAWVASQKSNKGKKIMADLKEDKAKVYKEKVSRKQKEEESRLKRKLNQIEIERIWFEEVFWVCAVKFADFGKDKLEAKGEEGDGLTISSTDDDASSSLSNEAAAVAEEQFPPKGKFMFIKDYVTSEYERTNETLPVHYNEETKQLYREVQTRNKEAPQKREQEQQQKKGGSTTTAAAASGKSDFKRASNRGAYIVCKPLHEARTNRNIPWEERHTFGAGWVVSFLIKVDQDNNANDPTHVYIRAWYISATVLMRGLQKSIQTFSTAIPAAPSVNLLESGQQSMLMLTGPEEPSSDSSSSASSSSASSSSSSSSSNNHNKKKTNEMTIEPLLF